MDVALLPLAAALALEPEAAPITSEPAEFQLSLALDAWLPRLEGDFTDAGAHENGSGKRENARLGSPYRLAVVSLHHRRSAR